MGGRYDPRKAAQFAQIDAANPEVWELFQWFTFQLIRRGFAHHSARDVVHRVRWETATPLPDGTTYKINDHWSPYYARKFHAQHPRYDGFFRNRPSRADEPPRPPMPPPRPFPLIRRPT